MRSILLVEDHAESRVGLAYMLEKNGYRVHPSANGRTALALARREKLHGMVLDLKLPDMEGLSVLDGVLEQAPGLPTIVVTGYATVDSAVLAMKRGAADFISKPIQVDTLLARLSRCIEVAGERGVVTTPPSEASAQMERLGMIGHSRAILDLFETVKRVAPHQSTVLVTGDSGTGKELIARALHALGPRAAGPFVAINCATLAEQILESELFGHEKGAFTSADRYKEGVMEIADKGTLFLDEVNEMGLGVQAKLLRALERREFRRVGGTKKITVDFNLVAASNANLERLVAGGRFRDDLYYRLKVVTISVPPLRDRREAIPFLAERFLADVAKHAGMTPKRLSAEAMAQLQRYEWPGNIRELRNCMESLTLLVAKPVLDVEDLPPSVRGAASMEIRLHVGMRMEDIEREVIRRNLECYPTIKEAARVLGVGLRTLHEKIQRHGLRRPRRRGGD
ncbi:MAG: sigma-54-dependent Fis family transcriptional regulator [Deltaproteobacteria bacterium]|nr:sigma-54-dependent Fis family transcriptional regulator [Deltaproteobacteria bacterium]